MHHAQQPGGQIPAIVPPLCSQHAFRGTVLPFLRNKSVVFYVHARFCRDTHTSVCMLYVVAFCCGASCLQLLLYPDAFSALFPVLYSASHLELRKPHQRTLTLLILDMHSCPLRVIVDQTAMHPVLAAFHSNTTRTW